MGGNSCILYVHCVEMWSFCHFDFVFICLYCNKTVVLFRNYLRVTEKDRVVRALEEELVREQRQLEQARAAQPVRIEKGSKLLQVSVCSVVYYCFC